MKQQCSYGFTTDERAGKNSFFISPSFVDVHVHFREPGFGYKETIRTGSMAAAAGGYTCVGTMPNLDPVPDSPEHLQEELDIISRDAIIDVRPYASITIGRKGLEVVDVAALKGKVIGFSDDGSGVQDDRVMCKAMETIAAEGAILAAHCEDNSLLRGGYIHDGRYAAAHSHRGICSESEWKQIERDLQLAKETGCPYHVCHISTKESVDIIRRAKDNGTNVSCETGPHYLILCEDDLQEDGRFKMNPPLRSREDRAALIEGLKDGTIDMIATDHAPHSAQEKAKGLEGSAMGIVGLETAFPVLYTGLVRKGIISLDRLIELMALNPRYRFGIPMNDGDRVLLDLETPFTIDSATFKSMGRSTPFEGMQVWGRCEETIYKGITVYKK